MTSSTTATVLDRIVAGKYAEVAARRAARPDLAAAVAAQSPPRGFRAALDAKPGYGLIAEIKKASPSKGLIRADFDPPAHARAYEAGGAACLSVLTDEAWFQGSTAYLEAARAAVSIPVLRKDFMVDPWQADEARAMGADAILLIAAALSDAQMAEIEAAAIAHGMDVLVEVHDEGELDRALGLRTRLIGVNNRNLHDFSEIGVNNRNLHDFSVDPGRTARLASRAPAGCTFVAESGLNTRADLDALAAQGVRCFLIGEALMRQPDVEAATRALLA